MVDVGTRFGYPRTAMPERRTKNEWDVEFGTFVRRLRKARHWAIADLARRMDMTPQYISSFERGANTLTAMTLRSLSSALNIRMSELLRMFEEEQDAKRAAAEPKPSGT